MWCEYEWKKIIIFKYPKKFKWDNDNDMMKVKMKMIEITN
jgi:hypothetical protein